jgi:hypothetical protein
MKPVRPQSEMASVERDFWYKYAQRIMLHNVSGKKGEWYIRYAQEFAYGLDGRHLKELEAADFACYLDELGRRDKFVAWQMRDAISALQILFCEMTECAWAADFDWAA